MSLLLWCVGSVTKERHELREGGHMYLPNTNDRRIIDHSYSTALIRTNKTFPVSEFYALRTFYYTLNGEYWLWETPTSNYGNIWNFSDSNISLINPCTDNWQGITCECLGSYCNIVQLVLEDFGLRGVLSDMRNLSMLTKIDLSENKLLRGNLWRISELVMLQHLVRL